jgi:hypothetical protein
MKNSKRGRAKMNTYEAITTLSEVQKQDKEVWISYDLWNEEGWAYVSGYVWEIHSNYVTVSGDEGRRSVPFMQIRDIKEI